MWQDLGDHMNSVLSNVLCRSIGGDESIPPKTSFGMKSSLPEAATLDDAVAPGVRDEVLDVDNDLIDLVPPISEAEGESRSGLQGNQGRA